MTSRGANSKLGKSRPTSSPTQFDFDKFRENATQDTIVGALSSSKRDPYKANIKRLEDAIRKKDCVLYDQVVKALDAVLTSSNKSLDKTRTKYEELKNNVIKAKDRGDRFANILLKGDDSTTSSTPSIPESKAESPTGSIEVTGSKKTLNSKPNDSDTTIVKRLLDIEAIYKLPEKDQKGKRQQPANKKRPTTDELLDSIERFCNKAVEEKHSLTETNQRMKKSLSQVQRWTVCLGKQVNDRSLTKEELTYTDDDIKCGEMDSILVGLTNIVTEMKDQDEKRKSTEEKHRKLLSLIDTNITLKHNQKEARKDKQDPQVEELDVCISEVEKMYDVLSNWSNKLTVTSELVKETTNKLWVDTRAQKTKKTHETTQIKHPAHCLKCKLDFLETQLEHLGKVCNRNGEIVDKTDTEIENLQQEIEEWSANGKIELFDKGVKGSITAIRSAREKLLVRRKEKEETGSSSRIKKLMQLCLDNGVKDPKEKNEIDMIGQLEKSLKAERESLKKLEKELVELQEDKTKYKVTKEKADVNTLLQMAKDAKANLQKYEREHQSLGRLQTMIEDLCKTNEISDATDKDDRYVNMIQQLDTRMKKEKSTLEKGLSQLQAKDDNKGSTVSNDDRSGIERLIEIARIAKKDVAQLQRYYEEEKESVKKYEDSIRDLSEKIEPDMQEIIDTLKDKNYADQEKHQRNQGNDKQKNQDDPDPFVRIRAKIEVMKRYSEEAMSILAYTSEMILSLEPTQQNKPGGRRSMIRYINVLLDKVTKNEITWGNVSFLNGEIEKMNAGLAKWKEKAIQEENEKKDYMTRLAKWQREATQWEERAIQEENEKKDYMTRLSKIASANLTNDNPNIADLSDPNRQTKLAEEYSQLYDNEWTNAFEDVEKKPELNPIDYLRDILTTVYDDCAEIRRLQIKKIRISILQPAKLLTEISKPPSPEADKDESAKQKGSKQETKKKPNRPLPPTPGPGGQTNVALGGLQSKAISEVVKQSYADALLNINRYFSSSYEEWFKTQHLTAYTTKCIELCWLMNIHSPPVCLGPIVQKGAKFDKNIYRGYTARGKQVEFVVWPAILLHEKGPLLGKGVAQGMK